MVEATNPRVTGDWTQEAEDQCLALYKEHGDADKVADLMGRARKSVIGKLSHKGVYVKPEKPRTVKKDDGPTKGEIQDAIEKRFGFEMDGFAAATRPALQRLEKRFEELYAADED